MFFVLTSASSWVCFTQKVLTDALGMVGQVKKERHLFMVGQTRVHVDTVEGLGHFMELEVCKPFHLTHGKCCIVPSCWA